MDQTDKGQIAYWMEQIIANLGEDAEKTLEYCSRIFSYAESDGEFPGEDPSLCQSAARGRG